MFLRLLNYSFRLSGVIAKSHSTNANKVAITAAQLLANVDKIDVEHISYGKKRLSKLDLS